MTRVYNYKLTVNEAYWTAQLKKVGKALTKKDRKLLRSVKYEKQDNESMARIQTKALTNGLYIPCLTDLVGDCMFESIEKTGFCEDRKEFRRSVALLMFLFGECNVIKTYNASLKSTFESFNDIEYVYCHNSKRLYKYTYYTMCSDMFSDGSWSRLPTEIILTVISIFFKVRINIYHDNGHVNKICDPDLDKTLDVNDPQSNINIALIGENHYVPLAPVPHKDIASLKCPKYKVQLTKFLKWAREKADMVGLYEDDDDDSSDSSNDEDDQTNSEDDHKSAFASSKSNSSSSSNANSKTSSKESNEAKSPVQKANPTKAIADQRNQKAQEKTPQKIKAKTSDQTSSEYSSDRSTESNKSDKSDNDSNSDSSDKRKKLQKPKSINIEEDLDVPAFSPPKVIDQMLQVNQSNQGNDDGRKIRVQKREIDVGNSKTSDIKKVKKTVSSASRPGSNVVLDGDMVFFL
ncbi:hypothetical protein YASMINEVIRUS_293 [Yasminevirus sp. GU-2018]|uniref:OTU domain-containing protein n=1 Tax=Yasminevirus sp. GU-2018 TaxID=2420051 RepID=A0A5K0U7R9_9VIRU|nr:hypothetical protein YASMINEVIRUS_293 [Yasminevirus sp. GU-2018]